MRGWLVSPASEFLLLVLQLMANWHRPIIQQVFPPMALYCNRLWICVASLVDFVHCRYQLSISETAKKYLVHSNTVSRQEGKHLRCGNIMQFSGQMSEVVLTKKQLYSGLRNLPMNFAIGTLLSCSNCFVFQVFFTRNLVVPDAYCDRHTFVYLKKDIFEFVLWLQQLDCRFYSII